MPKYNVQVRYTATKVLQILAPDKAHAVRHVQELIERDAPYLDYYEVIGIQQFAGNEVVDEIIDPDTLRRISREARAIETR